MQAVVKNSTHKRCSDSGSSSSKVAVGPHVDIERSNKMFSGAGRTMWQRMILARIGRAAAQSTCMFKARPGPKATPNRSQSDA